MKEIKVACDGKTLMDYRQLTPMQGNLKNLSKDNFQKLKKEILELGFSEPISIWKSDKNYILNGHQRLNVIKHMVENEGYLCPKLPVNIVQARDEKEARKKILALTSQYGEITSDGLYEFMSESDISADELIESFNFPEIDFDKFGAEYFKEEIPAEADEIPEIDESKVWVKLGDEFELGEHRLVCGDNKDCQLIDNHLILTDPPYGIDLIDNGQSVGGGTKEYRTKKFKAVQGDKEEFDPTWLLSFKMPTVMFGGNYFKLPPSKCWFVWNKKHIAERTFANCELAWTNLDRHAKVYDCTWDGYCKAGKEGPKVHPTQKPVKLISDVLADLQEYDNIFDPFGGSGTTLIACELLKRKCFMVEIDPYYCQVIIERWEKLTGKKAKKV